MTTISEDYISFEAAKLLKEKGFPQSTFRCHYIIDGNSHYKSFENRCGFGDYDIIAPTLAMAMKWLREEYDLYIEVSLSCDREDKNAKIFDASIFNLQNQRYKKIGNIQGYEQACEVAIRYCLENLI